MKIETFLNLPTEEVAQIVQEAGPKVCVFPINGTRRWFMIEHPDAMDENLTKSYSDIVGQRYIELYQLFFDHGITTLLSPIFGADLMERGEQYVQAVTAGMARLTQHPDFLEFYETYQVRVRFYGDYQRQLENTPYAYLVELFEEITQQTKNYDQNRLFFGVFASDATECIAELSIRYYTRQQRVPNRRTVIELYYGEYVPPVDLFIGFDKFSAFDMPLLAIGQEDLYFTVAPSPYLTEQQLRELLYDHLYTRPEEETDYAELTADDRHFMREFYQANINNTQGIGVRQKHGGFWIPLPQVKLSNDFALDHHNQAQHEEPKRKNSV